METNLSAPENGRPRLATETTLVEAEPGQKPAKNVAKDSNGSGESGGGVPPGSSWSEFVAAAKVVDPPTSPNLGEPRARLLAHCLLVPGLAEHVNVTIQKACLNAQALDLDEWNLLDVIDKQQRQYGNLILKQPDWPQRVKWAYWAKNYQDDPSHPRGVEGTVALAWHYAFGPTALRGSLEEGQGCLREVMQQTALTRLLENLRIKGFNWECYGDQINEYVSLLNELDAGRTETALRPGCETLTEFLRRPKEQPYLVDGILAAGQLAVIGGPEKGMKTNVTVDLAISLATGAKFLGHFRVPRPAKVLLVTGETCEKPLENLCRRILAARGLPDEVDNLLIKQDVPSLANKLGLNALLRLIKLHQAEVVVLDPLYLMVWDADPKGRPIDTNNITPIGKLVADVGQACVAAGATPVLVHPMSKTAVLTRADKREPMQLSALTGAGIGSVARQWLLLNYASPYDPETGRCAVLLNAGGSAGHGGLHLVAIDEGAYDPTRPLNGRTWHVEVQSGSKAIEAVNQAVHEAKAAKKEADCEEKAKKRTGCRKDPAGRGSPARTRGRRCTSPYDIGPII